MMKMYVRDQNSPDNVFSLKYYLNREQYGSSPLWGGVRLRTMS